MLLASELLELIKQRHPDKLPLVEIGAFKQGELVGTQKLIAEMEAEIKHGTVDEKG